MMLYHTGLLNSLKDRYLRYVDNSEAIHIARNILASISIRKTSVDGVVFVAGFQTSVINSGPYFIPSFLASFYFMLKSKFCVRTRLDMFVFLYVVAGFISMMINFVPALVNLEGYHSDALINFMKSFIVFLTVWTFFAGYRFDPSVFSKVSMMIISIIGLSVVLSLAYYMSVDLYALFSGRGNEVGGPFAVGWPQRVVVFMIIGYFHYFAAAIDRGRWWLIALSVMFMAVVLASGTRSAIIGILVGHLAFVLRSKKYLAMTLVLLAALSVVVVFNQEKFKSIFRFEETVEQIQYGGKADGSNTSIGYRLNELWPAVIDSVSGWRAAFGWGHIGVSYIPFKYFDGLTLFEYEGGSSEGQYIDVLQRQGGVGLIFYVLIILTGIVFASRMVKLTTGLPICAFWQGSVAWQIGAMLQGVTVETTRLPMYNLFYMVFLGMLSFQYYNVKQSNALRGVR